MLLKVCPLLADCFSLVTARSVLCLAAAIRASGYYGLRFPVDPGVRAAQQQNQQHWIVFLSRVFRRRAQLFGTVSSLSPSEEEPSLLLLGMLLLAACCLLLAGAGAGAGACAGAAVLRRHGRCCVRVRHARTRGNIAGDFLRSALPFAFRYEVVSPFGTSRYTDENNGNLGSIDRPREVYV